MSRQTMRWINLLVIIVIGALGAYGLSRVGMSADVAVQWHMDGSVGNYMPAPVAFFIVPLVAVFVSLLLYGLPWIEPRRENLGRSSLLYYTSWTVTLGVLLFAQTAIVTKAIGMDFDPIGFVVIMLGLVFILIGNAMGKSHSTFFLGIRTPWTLSNEVVWRRTHRIGGWLFVLNGVLTLILFLAISPAAAIFTMVGLAIATALFTVVYSFVLWRRLGTSHGDSEKM